MIAFDTDVLGLIWLRRDPYASRAQAVAVSDRGNPVVVAEELLRGRLDQIRKAEAGKSRLTLAAAYGFLQATLASLRGGVYLPFTDDAADLVAGWRAARIRVKPMDMRIAATAIVNGATLVTRIARDFRLIPGLNLDVWT
jgi:tRNA(fMet)-specific endonuclease VapC